MEQKVHFYSDGLRLAGVLFSPDGPPGARHPGIVMAQGAVGRKEYFGFPAIARRFAALGYVALIFDYRCFGDSEGPRHRNMPLEQVQDLRDALTFLQAQPNVDAGRLALFGTSMGGANVAYAGGVDARARWVISVVGYADNGRQLRGKRGDAEWAVFLARLAQDRAERVRTGRSATLERGQVIASDPASAAVRERVIGAPELGPDRRVPDPTMESVERMIEFRPIEVVDRISPRAALFIAAENDAVTPREHMRAMYDRAGEPKGIEVLSGIGHYEVYEEPHVSRLIDLTDRWIRAHP